MYTLMIYLFTLKILNFIVFTVRTSRAGKEINFKLPVSPPYTHNNITLIHPLKARGHTS